jgi:hypothetical protein
METVNFFEFFTIVPEIPSPKHHELQEFGKNCHISAMNFSNFTYSTALRQVHYSISFEVMSQKFINDNTLEEQGCAGIKKKIFLIFIAEVWQFLANSWIS